MKKTVLAIGAAVALSVLTAPAAFAQEPADCGAANVALQTAKTELDKAKADDEKAEKAKDADDAFDRADRDLRRADRRLIAAKAAIENLGEDGKDPVDGTEAEKAELKSAQKDLDQATKERDRARKQADKENADQLQRKADRTDAAELQKRLDAAQEDVNRLCGGVTTTPTTPTTPADPSDVDCDEVSDDEAQRILNADRSDPNNLDQDGDGVACEVDEILPESDNDNGDGDVTVNNNVAVPQGGVSTGVGPRDS